MPETMASYDNGAVQEVPVSTELLREAQQYRTVQTVQQWPVVANSATAVLDGYHSLKKEGDVARVVLTASEELAGLVCQLAVLPVVRSPLVRTPLRMADWVGGTGAALLQKAVPRLTDTKQPMRVGAELLLSLLLVPLTLSVALSRDLLQLTVSWLVTSFPSLEPAAKGFSDKPLWSQCLTVTLLVWLYLPLQLLSRPVQTVRVLTSVPSQVVSAAVGWAREAYSAVLDELTTWLTAVTQSVIEAVGWAAATAQTGYYVLFVMTGLEPALEAVLAWLRSLLRGSRDRVGRIVSSVTAAAPVSGLADRVATSDLAPVRWLRELWCGADSQNAEGDQRPARLGGLPARPAAP